MNETKIRIISSLIGILLILPFVIFGEQYFTFLVMFIALVCLYELNQLFRNMDLSIYAVPTILGTLTYIYLPLYFDEYAAFLALIAIVFLSAVYFILSPPRKIERLAATIFCSIYIGFFFSRLVMLRAMPDNGLVLTILLFTVVWTNDISAFFIGRRFGKRKLAPEISPNKTIEGMVAGLLLSTIIGGIFYLFIDFSLYEVLIIAFFTGLIGQFGDLFQSRLKRWAKVKDSGVLIPGHGGFLDRFDSLLFAAPACYYISKLFLI